MPSFLWGGGNCFLLSELSAIFFMIEIFCALPSGILAAATYHFFFCYVMSLNHEE
jgi:hypothetical protein